jgi:hypothetical protein
VKIFLFLTAFIGSTVFALSPTSRAAPFGAGFRGGGFHGRFVDHGAGRAFAMGHGFRRDHPRFGRQIVSPAYWNTYYWPDYYPLDYSLLDSDNDYTVGSSAPAKPQYYTRDTTAPPVIVVINQPNPRPTDSSNAGYANGNYRATAAEGQESIVVQRSNEQGTAGANSFKPVSPAVQSAPAAVQATQAVPQVRAVGSNKFVLVSWLNDGGKDIIYVQNTETNEVQKITSEPNIDNFRIVQVHPDADPKEFEAIISNGIEQTPVRFRF